MRRSSIRSVILCVVLAAVVVAAVGCSGIELVVGAASFAGGWLANNWLGGAQQTTCYRNGEPVDCSTLPPGLGQ